jgi:putative endonuclease
LDCERQYFVYIVASRRHGTLHIGVTNDLLRRVGEHREGKADGFTWTYSVNRLVYFEMFSDIGEAILREKRLKKWRRDWKIALTEENNPEWADLYRGLTQ